MEAEMTVPDSRDVYVVYLSVETDAGNHEHHMLVEHLATSIDRAHTWLRDNALEYLSRIRDREHSWTVERHELDGPGMAESHRRWWLYNEYTAQLEDLAEIYEKIFGVRESDT